MTLIRSRITSQKTPLDNVGHLMCAKSHFNRWRSGFALRGGFALIVLSVFLSGCAESILVKAECREAGNLSVICGFENPEDLVNIPGTDVVIVSEFKLGEGTGQLSLLDTATSSITRLFPGNTPQPLLAKALRWGDPSCEKLPEQRFNPHGIGLSTRADGLLQLLVVNHAERESVEFFEVQKTGALVALTWKGCAVAPEGRTLNDVVALPQGGFLVTHTGTDLVSPKGMLNALRGLGGVNIGHVLEWSAEAGFSKVPGTEVAYANGIQVSPRGGIIYLNEYFGNRVKKINRHTGELLNEIKVLRPDNLSWDQAGNLLVASQSASILKMAFCQPKKGYSCITGFDIISIDPLTFDQQTIVSHDGLPFGAATVAIRLKNKIYMGTYVGDRIAVATL
ncbi:MAG: hypothetical protein COB04_08505 [Gammaproteobacteria bacterium]|nr:MAG: hypothetical protein COB04_08505 [Gammaproteobacteria bacterium]